MRRLFQKRLIEVAHYLEILIAILLAISLVFFAINLFDDIFGLLVSHKETEQQFQMLLGHFMSLAVGVELIKMLTKPTPSITIEVLLVAMTRQLIVSHGSITEFVIGIVAVMLLFAIRKFLFSQDDFFVKDEE
ncbi:phosphate-starvation-inducible PsiE family protein [Streptococcus halichoeri]|uniref:phosphate-starvation-inducible PsiE family protein n=1 Tax=Streptococcus halichoeri TaxID=254785 RepID=UPI00135ACD88|nr:phosphate-starvation-inducible PsiE family protein [Streptococcus halichoeri]